MNSENGCQFISFVLSVSLYFFKPSSIWKNVIWKMKYVDRDRTSHLLCLNWTADFSWRSFSNTILWLFSKSQKLCCDWLIKRSILTLTLQMDKQTTLRLEELLTFAAKNVKRKVLKWICLEFYLKIKSIKFHLIDQEHSSTPQNFVSSSKILSRDSLLVARLLAPMGDRRSQVGGGTVSLVTAWTCIHG